MYEMPSTSPPIESLMTIPRLNRIRENILAEHLAPSILIYDEYETTALAQTMVVAILDRVILEFGRFQS